MDLKETEEEIDKARDHQNINYKNICGLVD